MRIIKRCLTRIYACDNSNELVDLIDSVRGSIVGTKNQKMYIFFDIDETLLK